MPRPPIRTLCGSILGDTKVTAPLWKAAPRASHALAFYSAARKRRTSAAFGVRPRCVFPVRTIESKKLAVLTGAQEDPIHLHIDDPIVKGASSTKRRMNVYTTIRPPNPGRSRNGNYAAHAADRASGWIIEMIADRTQVTTLGDPKMLTDRDRTE